MLFCTQEQSQNISPPTPGLSRICYSERKICLDLNAINNREKFSVTLQTMLHLKMLHLHCAIVWTGRLLTTRRDNFNNQFHGFAMHHSRSILIDEYLVDDSQFIRREIVIWPPRSLESSWQTKYNKRTVRNTSCPIQPSVHHREKVLISRVAVIVIKLYEQVIEFIAII